MTFSYFMVELKLAACVGEKGQVVIPKPVRDLFSISPGSEVVFSVQNDAIIIEKKRPRDALNEFISAVKDKVRFPKRVDWDKEYASQL